MRLPRFRNLSSLTKLSLFVVCLLTVSIFATISFSLREQGLVSKAWSVSESAQVQCDKDGDAEIAAKFRNTESDNSLAMNVSVKDVQTGLTADMGKVDPSQTGMAVIKTHRTQLDSSSVIFFLSWANNAPGTVIGLY